MARPVGRRGETRERILVTALALFAENGVHGTSLQQIADRLGVAKATVYHQFATKEALIQAVVQPAVDTLAALLAEAEPVLDRDEQVEMLLRGLVDLVINGRELSAVTHGDPGVAGVLGSNPVLRVHGERVLGLLLGPDPSPSRRVAVSMFNAGLMLSGTDPVVAGLPDAELRQELLAGARRLLAED
jgi:AcrR family transcriptional regulator